MPPKQILTHCTKVFLEIITKISWAVNLNRIRGDSFSVAAKLSTISQNLIESYDSTIPLRSNGSQALKPGFHQIVTRSWNRAIQARLG